MAAKKEETPVAVQEEPLPEPGEDRIDDAGRDSFAALGYSGRLPDSLVATYQKFKGKKDKLHPGPLSPEALVTVLFLAGLIDKEY
jgi:hypothetical protein